MGCTFFFGAGAESDYGLGVGASFVEPLLRDGYKEERKALLGPDKVEYSLIYPQSRNIYLQTIEENKEAAELVFKKKIVKTCIEYYQKSSSSKLDVTKLCKEWYRIITSNKKLKNKEEEIKQFFLKNGVFFSSLDEKFNSLRKQPFNNRANRVVNAYFTILILMIEAVYDIPNDFVWDYKNVFDLFQSENYKIKFDIDSYYKELAKLLKNGKPGKDNIFIATTNYTNIVEEVTKKSDVAFLHGKLEWFEDARNLTVYDCANDDERKQAEKNINNIFPFILIPSGVKPIICRKQIEQFKTFINQLDQSNIIFVTGYKFNSEDNHVNSLIGDWLRNPGNRMVYLNYESGLSWNSISWAEGFSKFEKDTEEVTQEALSELLLREYKILSVNAKDSIHAIAFFSTVCEYLKQKV